jgi:meiotically up-regulated gene 157 (Mug157) protein
MIPDNFPVVRISEERRRFKSRAVERLINEIKANTGNKEIGWLFENCFPNTLDTTVDFSVVGGRPDTYIITGDIDAMWLRDSTAQVLPYLPLCKEDKDLQRMIEGVIRRQTKCILLDPYANAFYKDSSKISEWKSDITDMKPGVHERQWEIDSLCYPIRLAYNYWKTTGDISPFDEQWREAMQLVIKTFREQQRVLSPGPYKFQRNTSNATDTLPLDGYGYPAKPNGLICSMFRPSDDATLFPYLVPGNFFAVSSLQNLAEMWERIVKDTALANDARSMVKEVWMALQQNAIIMHPKFGRIYAYEINGYGGQNLMDDANVPSLLGMPYLNSLDTSEAIYRNTRKYILSEENPFFIKGQVAEGVGSPHTGMNMIWPLGIIIRGITSTDPAEIKQCLDWLRQTHYGTGFMHESFNKDNPINFTRKWFAWANTLFGDFVWKVYRERKDLLS